MFGRLRKIFSSALPPSAVIDDAHAHSVEEGEAFKKQANAFLKAGKLADAVLLYRRAVSCNPKDARAHFALGYALREQGYLAEAVFQLEVALSIDDRSVDAHYVLGSIHQEAGRLPASIKHFQRVLDLDPVNAFVPRQLCLAYFQAGQMNSAKAVIALGLAAHPDAADLHLLSGNLKVQEDLPEEAVVSFRKALAIQPDLAEAHYNCGLALQGLSRFSEALSSYDSALLTRPDYLAAMIARAKLLRELDRMPEALASFDRAIAVDPRMAESHGYRALVLMDLKRFDEALASVDRALNIAPDLVDALVLKGDLLKELEQPGDALTIYQSVLRSRPNDVGVLSNCGLVLEKLQRLEEAVAAYDLALQVSPEHPEVLNNRGLSLRKLKRFDEALGDFDRARKAKPDLAEAHANFGSVLTDLGRNQEAVACYEQAFAINPSLADVRFFESMSRLILGDFDIGWLKYESRWQSSWYKESQRDQVPRKLAGSLWLGEESLDGKTILLHPEQGLGDTIQFCRYARHLASMGAKVFLEVQNPLKALTQDLDGVAMLFASGEPLPKYDLHCPLLSLPLACKTTLESIPSPDGYLGTSVAHRANVALWEKKLGPKTLTRVGLVWSGNANHRNDANRSIPLAEFTRLVSDRQHFYSLQNELRDADRESAGRNDNIRFFSSDLTDFSETAALIANLDLVICVDTSVAHLAGAMGKTVWLLLPLNPDFRWLLGRDDSPWYSSMKLFRQLRVGDWDSVLTTVGRELDAFSKAEASPT